MMMATVEEGGEGPPPGPRPKFERIRFQVDVDGKAFLELSGGEYPEDDPANLVLPSSDPARCAGVRP